MSAFLPGNTDGLDAIDHTLMEALRLSLLAVEVLKNARPAPNQAPDYPRPSVRAATLLRCAAEILADLSR